MLPQNSKALSIVKQSHREENYAPEHWIFLKDITILGTFFMSRELRRFQHKPYSQIYGKNKYFLSFWINLILKHYFIFLPFSFLLSFLLWILSFVCIPWNLFLIFFLNKDEDKKTRDISLVCLVLPMRNLEQCLIHRKYSINSC